MLHAEMLRRTFIKLAATGSVGLCVPALGKSTPSPLGEQCSVVVESREHRVSLCFADGRRQVIGELGTQPGAFNHPKVAVLRGDRLFVADTGNSRIQVFDRGGTLIRTFGKFGRGVGELAHPAGLVVTDDGLILVADTFNHRLVRYREDGSLLGYFGEGLNAPHTLAFDDAGDLHVTDYQRTAVIAARRLTA